MNKFDTVTTTYEALTKNKKPDCVTALSALFHGAILNGYTTRQAYHYAEAIHFVRDHDGNNHAPDLELEIEPTDEAIRREIVRHLLSINTDGRAQERIETVLSWYDQFRAWGVNPASAFFNAADAGQEEWESLNDMDEAEAIETLNGLSEGDEDDELTNEALILFYELRNEGNSVWASMRETIHTIQERLEREQIWEALSLLVGKSPDEYLN